MTLGSASTVPALLSRAEAGGIHVREPDDATSTRAA